MDIEPEVIAKAIDQINNTKAETETDEEIQRKIDLLENSRINLKVPNHIYAAIERQAEFKKMTIEEYCIGVLKENLETKIGTPWITSPSTFGETKAVTQKITTPTYQVERG